MVFIRRKSCFDVDDHTYYARLSDCIVTYGALVMMNRFGIGATGLAIVGGFACKYCFSYFVLNARTHTTCYPKGVD
jgi:ABC-type thiamin/hydroxymethylpyrimidine transport system permease subunit